MFQRGERIEFLSTSLYFLSILLSPFSSAAIRPISFVAANHDVTYRKKQLLVLAMYAMEAHEEAVTGLSALAKSH